jgi:hypothetical protein
MRVTRANKDVLIVFPSSTSDSLDASALDGLDLSRGITLGAIIDSADGELERSQALISQWPYPREFGGFAGYNAAGTDGLNTTGYFGAVFDGRFVYFVPEQHATLQTHANVLRYDTQRSFYDPESYCAFDASHTSGLDVRGFYGGAFDGRYVYFIPRQLDMERYHTRLLRYDTQNNFKDPAAWDAHDIGLEQSAQSCAFDGRYLYFAPGFTGDPKKENEYCGKVIRFDTQSDFHASASYGTADLKQLLGGKAACFDGGAFDGRFIYFVPLYDHVIVRYDVTKPFTASESWQQIDLSPLGVELFVGAVFDGKYLYPVPYASSRAIRFDVSKRFEDLRSWESVEVGDIDGLKTVGFDGGFFDGRYVHFVPFVYGSKQAGYTFHSSFLRYDPAKPFTDRSAWCAKDAILTDGLKTTGYNAGAFDGRFFYCAPWQQGRAPLTDERIVHGKILRYDTVGDRASFSLRFCDYGHNGGLNAGVRGPTFLVNTDAGVRSISIPRSVGAGTHRIAARFDGREIAIVADSEQLSTPASGRMHHNAMPILIGSLDQAMSRFRGKIGCIGIASASIAPAELLEKLHQSI